MRATDTTSAGGARRRGFRAAVGLVVLLVAAACLSVVAAEPAPAAKARGSKALARLEIKAPNVEIMKKGSTAFVAAKNNQVLRQGDALRTDTAGLAEVAYTDGSLTRLGPSTEVAISRLTSKKGARQTQGTLTVGSTWNRAAKVSESGEFSIKAGGATAAVEGTAFVVSCSAVGAACSVTAIVDDISVTSDDWVVTSVTDAP